jgi:hypothetical protein
MRIITADSALDLRVSAPSWVDDRATLCSSNLVYFDPLIGFLQFHTNCAASRNTWSQSIIFDDWESIVTLRHPWEGPLFPEMEETRIERERIEKETMITGDETWPEVQSKFPELINMDIMVYCDCPAFLWWGAWYNVEQRDSAMFPEGIPPPKVRDPSLSNVICKHLAAVFAQHF